MARTKKTVEEESVEKKEEIVAQEKVETTNEQLNEKFKKEGFEINPETGEPLEKVEKPKNWMTIVLLILLGILILLIVTIVVLQFISGSSSGSSGGGSTCSLGGSCS